MKKVGYVEQFADIYFLQLLLFVVFAQEENTDSRNFDSASPFKAYRSRDAPTV